MADRLVIFFRTALDLENGICSAVMNIQNFGGYTKWHSHIHFIVGDGVFRRRGLFVTRSPGPSDKLYNIGLVNIFLLVILNCQISGSMVFCILTLLTCIYLYGRSSFNV